MRKLLLMFCCVFSLAVLADDDYEGPREGTVNNVDEKYQFVVIDDGMFPFALNAKFKDAKGREVNRYALKPGMTVRYSYSEGANGYNHITDVQIIQK